MSFSLFITAFSWLVPNHYVPWPSAWNEAVAIFGLLLSFFLAVAQRQPMRFSGLLFWFFCICVISALLQFAVGKLNYFGDAAMVILYAGVWFGSVLLGGAFAEDTTTRYVDHLAVAWLVCASLSVLIALIQWTGVFSLGIYGAEMPEGARPFGNVAQPNHLCTIVFIGICASLWLKQQKILSSISLFFLCALLAFGMVLSQSRTGWIQMAWLGACLLAYFYLAKNRVGIKFVILLLAYYFVLVIFFDALSESLLISASRPLSDQMKAGTRLPFWAAMVDAITREPLWGYGWLQVGLAHQTIALDHGEFKVLHEHSHNFILDMILWNGLLVGGVALSLLCIWAYRVRRTVFDRRAVWLVCALGGMMIHAMLEYPLEYSYIMIPAGLAMGFIENIGINGNKIFVVPRFSFLPPMLLICFLFALVVKDYWTAEQNFRDFRMEAARIGVGDKMSVPPDLIVLDQLKDFLTFARTDATRGMGREELDAMKRVMTRFGYPSVMFRYALATGINDQPGIAATSLQRLCRIHGEASCNDAKEAWKSLSLKYPELERVPF